MLPSVGRIVPRPVGTADAELTAYQHPKQKMNRIGKAMHKCQDAYRRFPGANFGPDGAPSSLSWRVHLLPFVEQQELYDQFHPDEPWDSPHNRQLVESMPEIYRMHDTAAGKTSLHVFVGEQTPFENAESSQIHKIIDGTSRTIMAALGGPETATEWTRPGGLEFDPSDPLKILGSPTFGGYPVIMFDSQVKTLPPDLSAERAAMFITSRGEKWDHSINVDELLAYFDPTPPPVRAHATPVEANLLTAQKMKAITQAMWDWHKYNQEFPLDQRQHRVGEPTLSWRVAILPFLGERELVQQFHSNEKWDSPHNRKLLNHVPEVFRTPETPPGKTRLHVFAGPATPFNNKSLSSKDIADGNTNTIMIVLSGPESAVEWTRPGGIAYTDAAPLSMLGTPTDGGYPVVMFDNSVRLLPGTASPAEATGLITNAGGEESGGGDLLKLWRPGGGTRH